MGGCAATRPGGRRAEGGQVTTGIVLSVVVCLVAVALFGVVALSRGADERSKSQSAADAAALAGAEALETAIPDIVGRINSRRDVDGLFACGLGRPEAAEFASRNEAGLTGYCFDAARDEVRVTVRMSERVTDAVGPATATSVASPGLRLGACRWEDDEPPEPTPTPTPTGSASPDPTPTTPPRPPDFGTTLTCGPLTARFEVDGETGRLHVRHVDLDPLSPRLVR